MEKIIKNQKLSTLERGIFRWKVSTPIQRIN